jgi:hypothetical protein
MLLVSQVLLALHAVAFPTALAAGFAVLWVAGWPGIELGGRSQLVLIPSDSVPISCHIDSSACCSCRDARCLLRDRCKAGEFEVAVTTTRLLIRSRILSQDTRRNVTPTLAGLILVKSELVAEPHQYSHLHALLPGNSWALLADLQCLSG